MATRRLSPTAELLRHSRLFSLPPRLRQPSNELAGSTTVHNSDTATLPYPIHASIETPPSSLSRGDWGLKRPLPLRSTTNTTTPAIRVTSVDTINHITEFDSAGDHTITLRKWQEMNIPISMPARASTEFMGRVPPAPSVLEEELQHTQEVDEIPGSKGSIRWKFKGPWLAGKSDGEFEDYIQKQIKRLRPQFQQFIRNHLKAKKAAHLGRRALDKGEKVTTKVEVWDDELQAEILKLRDEPTELWEMIWKFLDLPGEPPRATEPFANRIGSITGLDMLEQGPPATHPSAGLSYLGTVRHVPNHPILGPMISQPPVLGRIIQDASSHVTKSFRDMVGLGGVIVSAGPSRTFRALQSDNENNQHGGKAWVHPTKASIDSRGRIKLSIENADANQIAVWENVVDPNLSVDGSVVGGGNRTVPDFRGGSYAARSSTRQNDRADAFSAGFRP